MPEVPLLQIHQGVSLSTSPRVLRVLVFYRDGQFLAQGIEFDINAQGPTEKQAIQSYLRFLRARAQMDIAQGREPLMGVPQAPQQYIDVWERLEEEHRQNSESFPAEPGIPDLLGNHLPAYVIHALAQNSTELDLSR